MLSNGNISEIIKLVSELYDTGDKELKALKDRKNQSKEIHGMPVNALFIGSQDNIIFDNQIKAKFRIEFNTKLARRSFFIYAPERLDSREFSTVDELVQYEEEMENNTVTERNKLIPFIEGLAEDLLPMRGSMLEVSKEVRDLFTLYKKYNEAVADTITVQYPITKLSRAHMQWKALKLSGALALMEESDHIELDHYRAAIQFTEMIGEDIKSFETELSKEGYELLANYVRMYAIDGECRCSLHTLRKMSFVSGRQGVQQALKDLQKMVASYDTEGIYKIENDELVFQELQKATKIGISYLPCKGNKAQRAKNCSTGYIYQEGTFSDIENLLQEDLAYTPFKFTDGIRGKDNIEGGCKWIVLDVDDSNITDKECDLLLSDLNHYVVRTSKNNVITKYRVILELDAVVNVSDTQWVTFIQSIATDLGIICDKLPKAQIFFSYRDREMYKQLEASPLETKPYLLALGTEEKRKTFTKVEMAGLLGNQIDTFNPAFEAKDGSGRRKMVWAVRYARELGADLPYCLNLLDNINEYWVKPMPNKDLESLKNNISRWEW